MTAGIELLNIGVRRKGNPLKHARDTNMEGAMTEDLDSLLSRIQQNSADRLAWIGFYKGMQSQLCRYAYGRVRNGERAEDLAHVALSRFYTSRAYSSTASIQDARKYLFATIRNLIASGFRGIKGQVVFVHESVLENHVAPGSEETRDSLPTSINELIPRLDLKPKDAQLLALVLANQPLSKIAATLKIKIGTASTRINRLKQKLRDQLVGKE